MKSQIRKRRKGCSLTHYSFPCMRQTTLFTLLAACFAGTQSFARSVPDSSHLSPPMVGETLGNFQEVPASETVEARDLQACYVNNYASSVTPTNKIYVPGSPPVTTFKYTLTQTPDCGYTNNVSIEASIDFLTHNRASQDFTIFTDDYANSGAHYVTIKSSLTQPDGQEKNTQVSFFLIVKDPCKNTQIQAFQIADQSTTVKKSLSIELPTVYDSISFEQGNQDGLTFCGARTFTITEPSPIPPFMQLKDQKITVLSNSEEYTGVYTVTVQVAVRSITKIAQFTLTLNPCQVSFFMIMLPGDAEYTVRDPRKNIGKIMFTQGGCSHPVTYELGQPDDAISIDEETGMISVYSTDMSKVSYRVTVIGSVWAPVDAQATQYDKKTNSKTFMMTYVIPENPCDDTELDQISIEDMTITVHGGPLFQTVPEVADAASKSSGDGSGLTFCGPRTYSISGQPSFMNFNPASREISIDSSENTDVGQYTLEMTVSLDDYPEKVAVATLVVTVEPCQVDEFSISGPDDAFYSVGDARKVLGTVESFQGSCSYPTSFNMIMSGPAITLDGTSNEVSVFTEAPPDEDSIQVVIKGTIFVPTDHTRVQENMYTSIHMFTVSFQQPCEITELDEFANEEITVAVSGGPVSRTFPHVQDSQSKINGDQSGFSFCGSRLYADLNAPSFVSFDASIREIRVETTEDSDVGQHFLDISASLVNYPSVDPSQALVTVTVNPCQVEDFTFEGPDSAEYTIGNEVTVIGQLSSFQGNCNYPVSYELITQDMPITIDQSTGEISIQSTDSSLLSQSVQIKGTIQVPTDFTNSSFEQIENLYSFELTIHQGASPCDDTELDQISIEDMTITVHGGPLFQTVPEVADAASKTSGDGSGLTFCGPRTYSISGQPSFMSFDPASREISIESSENSDVGQYTLEMTVSLDDYPEKVAVATLVVTVEPCQVDELTVVFDSTSFSYTVADPQINAFKYEVQQSPDCGYPSQTNGFEQSTNFLSHNSESNDFTVFTNSKDDIGIHSVKMIVTVEVPTDFTESTFTTVSTNASLELTVKDPCYETQLQSMSFSDMIATSESQPITVSLPTILDSISQSISSTGDENTPFCGSPVFQILPDTPMITIVENKELSFDPSLAEVGQEYSYEVQVGLVDYPSVATISAFFVAKVQTCQLEALTPPPDIKIEHFIRSGQQSMQLPEFEYVPSDCASPLEHTIRDIFDVNLPPWITLSGTQLTIAADDVSLEGQTFTFEIEASTIESQGSDPPLRASFELVVEFFLDCSQDQILELAPLSDQFVTLDEQGNDINFSIEFSQVKASCSVSLTLERKEDNSWRTLNSFEESVVSLDLLTKQVVIKSHSRELDGQIWPLRLTVENENSSQKLSSEFKVEFKDACWSASLSPISLSATDFELTLYEDTNFNMEFSLATTNMPHCGSISYLLQIVKGNVSVTDFELAAQTGEISAQIQDRSSIGQNQIRIIAEQAAFAQTSADFWLTVKDPCHASVLELQNDLPETLFAQDEELASIEMIGPSNSVSRLYGNSYDLCGPLRYTLQDQAGRTINSSSSQVTLSAETNLISGDLISLSVEQDPGKGILVSELYFIEIRLKNYPQTSPVYHSIEVTYWRQEECKVQQFTARKIIDQTLSVASESPLSIKLWFNQASCNFPLFVSAQLIHDSVRDETEVPLVEVDVDSMLLLITSPGIEAAIGNYNIKVVATLTNMDQQEVSTTFKLSVVPEAEQSQQRFKILPKFQLDVKDLELIADTPIFEYPIRVVQLNTDVLPLTNEVVTQEVTIDLSRVSHFASFDNETNSLVFENLQSANTGPYDLKVVTVVKCGDSYQQKLTKRIKVTILQADDTVQKAFEQFLTEDSIEEPEQQMINLEEWSGQIAYQSDLKTFSEDQPVPYVDSISETGQLLIQWDREMQTIEDVEEIDSTEVLLRESQRLLRRQLDSQFWLLSNANDSEKVLIEKVQIKKALEVKLSGDDKVEYLAWSVLEQTAKTLKIQIEMPDLTQVSQQSLLSVTFWDTQNFKSLQDSFSVRIGTQIFWPLSPTISKKESDSINSFLEPLAYFTGALILLQVLTHSVGSLVPVWTFINSVQLLAHLPLFGANLPPLVQQVLTKILSLCRLDWIGLHDEDQLFHFAEDASKFEALTISTGYTIEYSKRLQLCLLAALAVCLAQTCLLEPIIRTCIPRFRNRKASKGFQLGFSFTNLTLRLTSLLLIQILISSLVILLFNDDRGDGDTSHFTLMVQVCVLVSLVCLTVYLCVQSITRGPQTKGLYQQKTILESFFFARPFKSEEELRSIVQGDLDLLEFAKMQNEMHQHFFASISSQKDINFNFEALDTMRKLLTSPRNETYTMQETGEVITNTIAIKSPERNLVLKNKVVPEVIQTSRNNIDFEVQLDESVRNQVGTSPQFILQTDDKMNESKESKSFRTPKKGIALQQATQDLSANNSVEVDRNTVRVKDPSQFQCSELIRHEDFEPIQRMSIDTSDDKMSEDDQNFEKARECLSKSGKEIVQVKTFPREQGTNQQFEGGESDLIELRGVINLPGQGTSVTQTPNVQSAERLNEQQTDKLNQGKDDGDVQDFSFSFEGKGIHKFSLSMVDNKKGSSRIVSQRGSEQRDNTGTERGTLKSTCQSPNSVPIFLNSSLLAKIKAKLDKDITISSHCRSLTSGLKLNHPRNAAFIYPLGFVLRRAALAVVILLTLYLSDQRSLSMLAFLCSSLTSLVFTASEKQWKENFVNRQHLACEACVYFVALLALGDSQIPAIMLIIIVVMLVFNLILLTFRGLNALRLHLLKLLHYAKGRKFKGKKSCATLRQQAEAQMSPKHDIWTDDLENQVQVVEHSQEQEEVAVKVETYDKSDPLGVFVGMKDHEMHEEDPQSQGTIREWPENKPNLGKIDRESLVMSAPVSKDFVEAPYFVMQDKMADGGSENDGSVLLKTGARLGDSSLCAKNAQATQSSPDTKKRLPMSYNNVESPSVVGSPKSHEKGTPSVGGPVSQSNSRPTPIFPKNDQEVEDTRDVRGKKPELVDPDPLFFQNEHIQIEEEKVVSQNDKKQWDSLKNVVVKLQQEEFLPINEEDEFSALSLTPGGKAISKRASLMFQHNSTAKKVQQATTALQKYAQQSKTETQSEEKPVKRYEAPKKLSSYDQTAKEKVADTKKLSESYGAAAVLSAKKETEKQLTTFDTLSMIKRLTRSSSLELRNGNITQGAPTYDQSLLKRKDSIAQVTNSSHLDRAHFSQDVRFSNSWLRSTEQQEIESKTRRESPLKRQGSAIMNDSFVSFKASEPRLQEQAKPPYEKHLLCNENQPLPLTQQPTQYKRFQTQSSYQSPERRRDKEQSIFERNAPLFKPVACLQRSEHSSPLKSRNHRLNVQMSEPSIGRLAITGATMLNISPLKSRYTASPDKSERYLSPQRPRLTGEQSFQLEEAMSAAQSKRGKNNNVTQRWR